MKIGTVRGQKIKRKNDERTLRIFIPHNPITSFSFSKDPTCHFIHGQFQFPGKFPDSANDIGADDLICTQIILFSL